MNTDLQQLQRTWQAIRVETAAGPVPAEVARRLRHVFEGDRVTLFEEDQATSAGAVAVHPAATPKAIDVCFPDGESALTLVAARLRPVAGTKWGTRRYLDRNRLEECHGEWVDRSQDVAPVAG